MHNPKNYKEIHLTSQLSKCAERILLSFLLPRVSRSLLFGPFQFAYNPGHGARDAISYFLFTWLLLISSGCRIGLYCSDVAGAFDRVKSERLLSKLRAFGLPTRWCDVFASWLEARTACVTVAGACSRLIEMADMVFQGAVLGPPSGIYFQ